MERRTRSGSLRREMGEGGAKEEGEKMTRGWGVGRRKTQRSFDATRILKALQVLHGF